MSSQQQTAPKRPVQPGQSARPGTAAVTAAAPGRGAAAGRGPLHTNHNGRAPAPRRPRRPGGTTEGDEAARAALALAAVAQAATASNRSPAEAAEIAKAQAQLVSKKQPPMQRRGGPARPEPRRVQRVQLDQVKEWLQTKESPILATLSAGSNDAFLRHLLLMEHLRAPMENENEAPAESPQVDEDTELRKTQFACDRVTLLLSKVELAYDSMSRMLPADNTSTTTTPTENEDGVDDTMYFDESPTVVPDLLPPCIALHGDATQEFFRACLGESESTSASSKGDNTATTTTTNSRTDDGTEISDLDSLREESESSTTSDDRQQQQSLFSGMFRRNAFAKKGFASVFGKKNKGRKEDDADGSDKGAASCCKPGEYSVQIERAMLGLTVENVLERTVVRTVIAGGPAKKAGARVGSLIVKVGNVETRNLTHFETIDELRQSQRPLQLILRQISDDSLRSAREEMGRLIRGSGFGKIIDGEPLQATPVDPNNSNNTRRLSADRNIDLFTSIIRKRCIEAASVLNRNKKDEPILRVAEKLIWILTLFVVGLERESARMAALESDSGVGEGTATRGSKQYQHTSRDYAEAAKSVSKVLFDFIRKRMDPVVVQQQQRAAQQVAQQAQAMAGRGRGVMGGRGGRGGRGPGRGGRGMTMIPGMGVLGEVEDTAGEKLLLQIGDVLQRTRAFLADPTSPPAALLRGELIACLCDILDADTEMKLSEDENMSAHNDKSAGPITDLGAAGSLLKLIVLNCPMMRSVGCEEISAQLEIEEEEIKRRFGEVKSFSASDCHRLHAGNRFLAVVHRLAASKSTSSRITACSLGPVLWSHLDFPHQLQLRGVITRNLHDVEVIVRKSTATVLHEIAELVFDSRCVPWLVLMCERAMTDPEPLLRSAAMTLTWHLADHLPNAFVGDASQGSRYLRRLPSREDPIFADVYLLQCKLLPVATRLAEDRAPQVRLAVAAQCDRLCDALGDHWSSVIIDVLVAMLSDSDERVRSEAVLCVPRLADVVLLTAPPGVIPAGESSVLDALVPAAMKLQKDQNAQVRIALATAAGELLTLLVGLQQSAQPAIDPDSKTTRRNSIRYEKRHTDDRLIPVVQKLLEDPDPEVTSSALRAVTNASRGRAREIRARLNTEDDDSQSIASMTSHTSSIGKESPVFLPVLSEEQVLRLMPTLSELANSKQWRVRQSAVEIVPALLGCTTEFDTRAEIAALCIRLTADKIDAVRRTAAECLCLGGGSLGSHEEDISGEWITALVIPQIQVCSKHKDYRQRLLGLKMVEVILLNGVCPLKWKDEDMNAAGKNTPLREMLKVTLSLAEDRIANVRLNVGKVLVSVLHVFGEEECRVIKYAVLQQLKKERQTDGRHDRDVLYFGDRCLEKLRNRMDLIPKSQEAASTVLEEADNPPALESNLTAL